MALRRLIARMDIKGTNVIKGLQMEGLRVVGPVEEVARQYFTQGVDELLVLDTVASLYGRDLLAGVVRELTRNCFIPVTAGGGIRSVRDADELFDAGADKVAVNTAALQTPVLIEEISSKYGSQALVVHIEAKSARDGAWHCYFDSGREDSGREVQSWALEAENRGAGELTVSNVDRDGMRSGYSYDLLSLVASQVTIPVVASSGAGRASDLVSVFQRTGCEGVAVGAAFHWGSFTVSEARRALDEAGIAVRKEPVGSGS